MRGRLLVGEVIGRKAEKAAPGAEQLQQVGALVDDGHLGGVHVMPFCRWPCPTSLGRIGASSRPESAKTWKMAATSSRTLRLLSLLQNHRYWSGDELAARLEVSIRTVRRDVDRLRELGYPVLANRGVAGGYQLEAGATLPPLLLDDEEAVGLAVALQTAAQESVAGIAESSLRALAKLTQVMPPRLRHRVDALRAATEVPTWSSAAGATSTPETLVAIALACRDRERLTFGYRSVTSTTTDRQVEPLRLVSLGRRWYLVAYDLDRQDWRSFRMDRIDEPRPTGQRFRTRELPASDAASFVRQGIEQLRSVYG